MTSKLYQMKEMHKMKLKYQWLLLGFEQGSRLHFNAKSIKQTILLRDRQFIQQATTIIWWKHMQNYYTRPNWVKYCIHIQLTLFIWRLRGPSETLQDNCTSTYQIFRIGENTNRTTKFHQWICNLTPLVRNIYWNYCGKGEKLLLRSNFSSYSQYFNTWS